MTKKVPRYVWQGKSGTVYEYLIGPIGFSFDKNIVGNYIFCKKVNSVWKPIYIGQGNLLERTKDPEHLECSKLKGATHIHVRRNPLEKDRLMEEDDLLESHPEAYDPVGCNKKKGG